MTSASVPPITLTQSAHDGVNQAGRAQAALAPAYVAVDERSLRDLLAFTRTYANELRIFNVHAGRPQAIGNWAACLGTDT